MKKYWCLSLNNYLGKDDTCYFKDYEIALANFKKICEKYKDFDEFEMDENSCSWFDAEYDEYSTYVRLIELPMPKIFNKIIF